MGKKLNDKIIKVKKPSKLNKRALQTVIRAQDHDRGKTYLYILENTPQYQLSSFGDLAVLARVDARSGLIRSNRGSSHVMREFTLSIDPEKNNILSAWDQLSRIAIQHKIKSLEIDRRYLDSVASHQEEACEIKINMINNPERILNALRDVQVAIAQAGIQVKAMDQSVPAPESADGQAFQQEDAVLQYDSKQNEKCFPGMHYLRYLATNYDGHDQTYARDPELDAMAITRSAQLLQDDYLQINAAHTLIRDLIARPYIDPAQIKKVDREYNRVVAVVEKKLRLSTDSIEPRILQEALSGLKKHYAIVQEAHQKKVDTSSQLGRCRQEFSEGNYHNLITYYSLIKSQIYAGKNYDVGKLSFAERETLSLHLQDLTAEQEKISEVTEQVVSEGLQQLSADIEQYLTPDYDGDRTSQSIRSEHKKLTELRNRLPNSSRTERMSELNEQIIQQFSLTDFADKSRQIAVLLRAMSTLGQQLESVELDVPAINDRASRLDGLQERMEKCRDNFNISYEKITKQYAKHDTVLSKVEALANVFTKKVAQGSVVLEKQRNVCREKLSTALFHRVVDLVGIIGAIDGVSAATSGEFSNSNIETIPDLCGRVNEILPAHANQIQQLSTLRDHLSALAVQVGDDTVLDDTLKNVSQQIITAKHTQFSKKHSLLNQALENENKPSVSVEPSAKKLSQPG